MVSYRNGFVALSRQGSVIRETFRCPDHISPDYNPLRSVRAQYRVTSHPKDQDQTQGPAAEAKDFNPAQFNLSLMDTIKSKPSPTCAIL